MTGKLFLDISFLVQAGLIFSVLDAQMQVNKARRARRAIMTSKQCTCIPLKQFCCLALRRRSERARYALICGSVISCFAS